MDERELPGRPEVGEPDRLEPKTDWGTRPEHYRVTLASIGDAVMATDALGRVTFMNPVAEQLTGWSQVEAIGQPLERVFHIVNELTRAVVQNPVQRVLEQGVIVGLANSTLLIARDGREMPIDDSAAPVKDEQGRVTGAVLVFRDITERRRAEQAHRESEERFRIMADTAPVMIWVAGTDARCNFFNKPWLAFTGRTMDQELGNGWTEGIHPDDTARCMEIYLSAFQSREEFRMEHRLRRYDGEYRWVLNTGTPRFTDRGDFAGYIGSCLDITERKQAEEALAEREATLRALLEYASDGVVIANEAGRIVLANARTEAMFGYTRAELLDRPLGLLLPARLQEAHEHHRAGYMASPRSRPMGQGLELAGRRKDGSEFPVEISLSYVETRAGRLAMAFIIDITERQRTRQIIEWSAQRMARLYDEAQQEIASRKQAEAQLKDLLQEKEVLLKEVHHRVKNNLQAISNLLYLQATHTPEPQVQAIVRDIQNRIRSIALIHEKLYQAKDLTRLDLADYISSLVTHLLRSYQADPGWVDLKLEVDEVPVDVETAVPLGIIINELISNALKHAFPRDGQWPVPAPAPNAERTSPAPAPNAERTSPAPATRAERTSSQDEKEAARANEIGIELKAEPGNRLVLTVRDNGVGFPAGLELADVPSMGLQLVRVLADYMQGTVEIERNGGTTFRIKLLLPLGATSTGTSNTRPTD